jgi:hypothetical protein
MGQCKTREGRLLLVLDAPAEQVVTHCRRLAAQVLSFVPPRQVNEHVRVARVFFFPFFSIKFCSASASLRFSEAPRKFESQMPPLSSLFTNMFHLKLTFWRSTMNCLPRCLLVNVIIRIFNNVEIPQGIEPNGLNDISVAVSWSGSVSEHCDRPDRETRFAPCAPAHG